MLIPSDNHFIKTVNSLVYPVNSLVCLIDSFAQLFPCRIDPSTLIYKVQIDVIQPFVGQNQGGLDLLVLLFETNGVTS